MKNFLTRTLITIFCLICLSSAVYAEKYDFQGVYEIYAQVGQKVDYTDLYTATGMKDISGYDSEMESGSDPSAIKFNDDEHYFEVLKEGTNWTWLRVFFTKEDDNTSTFQWWSVRVHASKADTDPKLSFDKDSITLSGKDDTYQLEPTLTPDIFQSSKEITSFTGDHSLISISKEGLITGLKAGSTDATITYQIKLPSGKVYSQNLNLKITVLGNNSSSDSNSNSGTSNGSMGQESTQMTITNNKNHHNYYHGGNWGVPVKSYLEKTSNGYMRVEDFRDIRTLNEHIYITYFDNNFNVLKEKVIDHELPIFGAYYGNSSYNFLIFAQNNPDEKDDVETFRIVKYDKNWKRLDSVSITSADYDLTARKTFAPVDAASMRIAEKGKILYITTGQEMYKSNDGLNHQASLQISVNTQDLKFKVYNNDYVSHSFNQYVLAEGDRVITLNHGDAYPRAAQLTVNVTDSNNYQKAYSTELLTYAGELGNNVTNATIGGLESSNNNYLTVGSSTDQKSSSGGVRNIYLTVTPKNFVENSSAKSNLIWLTNNTSGRVSNPHLVKISNDKFLVLWSNNDGWGNDPDKISYVYVDGNGKAGTIKTVDGAISDCKPIVENGKVLWYVGDGSKLTFYSLDGSGNLKTTDVVSTVPVYRLYNRLTHEHLYTTDSNEVKVLTKGDWNDEGIGWEAPTAGTSVVRLYSPVTHVHLYSTDIFEIDYLSNHGWTIDNDSKPLFYSGGTKNIFRMYNPTLKMHLITTDMNEYNVLSTQGWNQEGVKLNGY